MNIFYTTFLTFTLFTFIQQGVQAQCAGSANIYSFNYNGKTYEVVRENKTWIAAASCAVERGGYLAEIDDQAEQDAIYSELGMNAGITLGNTVAPDGGNGSYVWIGGNDIAVEGEWIWDGDNDNSGPQFWMGTTTGGPVGGLYNNWGTEPDNYNDQDGLGLALTNWPNGTAGHWNDVDVGNTLYFLIEHDVTTGIRNLPDESRVRIYPNPASNALHIENPDERWKEALIYSSNGQEVLSKHIGNSPLITIDLKDWEHGIYLVTLKSANGNSVQKRFLKQL